MDQTIPYDKIVFFDGICVLCNRFADMIMKADRKRILKLATLQSRFATEILQDNQEIMQNSGSVAFYENGKLYFRSEAFFKIVKHLGFPFSLARFFDIFPRKLNDRFYNIIARNRYHWFGMKNTCRVPDESTSGRLIE
jgi:predicted DCC family thiol-disulfide oxidoreductase YuxK